MSTLGVPREDVAEQARATTRRLYEQHGQRVLTFCLSRLGDREEAQDAAQTTFVYVLRALERGVVPRHELAWLLKIAENVCHSSRRSLGRRLAATSSADVTELEAAAESLSPEAAEQLHDLREALELLPENQRRAVLLREWQGLSYAEIADELRLSVPAVEALLFRARRAIAAHVGRTRSRLVDLGSSLVALRSFLPGGAAKITVATAVVGAVTAPALVHEERRVAAGIEGRAAAPLTAAAAPRAKPRSARRPAARRRSFSARRAPARAAVPGHPARASTAARPAAAPPPAAAEPPPPPAPPRDTPPQAPAPPEPAPAEPAPDPVLPAAAPVLEPVAAAVPAVAAAEPPAVLAVPPLPALPGR